MIRPKKHIKKIYRIPGVSKTRINSIRMDKNEFLPSWPAKWFKSFLSKLRPEHLSIHPELGNLYKKIAKSIGKSEKNIVVTAGSDAGIRSCFEVFVEPGDRVVMVNPTFAMYYIYANIYRAKLAKFDYEKDLSLNVEKLIKAIDRKTKLVALANPNSPTGTVIKESDLIAIIRKASKVGAAVLVDEAYYPFYENSVMRFTDRFDNLIVARTFSKAAGLAGMRVGFMASNKNIARMLFNVKPMYEVTTLSVLSAEYVLDNYSRVIGYARAARKGRAYLAEFFMKRGYRVFEGNANFLHVDFGRDRKNMIKHLKKNNVLFKESFSHPSLKGLSRLTIGPKEAVKPLITIVEKFKG